MKFRTLFSVAAILLVVGGIVLVSSHLHAQDIDFGQITNSNHWGPARCTWAHHLKQL